MGNGSFLSVQIHSIESNFITFMYM